MRGILYSLLVIVLASCYTNYRATKDIYKAYNRYPNIVAKIARDSFPCFTLKADTVVNMTDTIINVDCPTPAYKHYYDTVHLFSLPAFYKVPLTLPFRTVTITDHIEDSAKIKLMQGATDLLIYQNKQLTQDYSKLILTVGIKEKKIGNRNRIIIILIAVIGISGAVYAVKFIYRYKYKIAQTVASLQV